MEPGALDTSEMHILMVAGGLFSLAGLWLMFRPKPEENTAKIELFGLKFESSSAGLLVFLIGAGFLALPIVISEAPDGDGNGIVTGDPVGQPEVISWRTLGQDTFTSEDSEWYDGDFPNDAMPRLNLSPRAGRYRWDMAFDSRWSFWTPAPFGPSRDFEVAVDVIFIDGETTDTWAGLLFGDAAGQNYRFLISGAGNFTLVRSNGDRGSQTVIASTPIPDEAGTPRQIRVRAENGTFRFEVNGTFVGAFAQPNFNGGKVGMGVLRFEPGAVVLDFDNFEYRVPAQ